MVLFAAEKSLLTSYQTSLVYRRCTILWETFPYLGARESRWIFRHLIKMIEPDGRKPGTVFGKTHSHTHSKDPLGKI